MVRNPNDCVALQHDLNLLTNWSNEWGLSFNSNKCEILRISRKKCSLLDSPIDIPYTINNHPLELVSSSKDLGILVNNKLTWNLQISSIVAKANKTLGFLYRHFGSSYISPAQRKLLYLSLVRSHLSYASEICRAPQSCITDLKQLENVQRRATRFILSCSRDPNIRPNCKTRLIALNLLPISYWLEYRDLCFSFRCINGLLNVQFDKYIQISSGRTRSSSENLNLYPIHRYRTSLFRDFFFNRIVKLWNSLPLQTRKSPTFNSFKTNLYKHYFSKLHNIFDTDRLNTWKTICPYCRSVNRPSCC